MGSRDALRERNFALFFTAAAISNAGSWMQLVALPAILFDLTNSATWLGISSVASLVPAVVLTPYAGVLADRVSRRTILIATQSVQMTVAFVLFFLYSSGHLTPHGIVTLGFVAGCATGIQTSAWQSFVPLLVPQEFLLDAVKLNSAQYTLARALGPAFAGVLVKVSGPGLALFVDAITFVLVIGALVLSRPRVGGGARPEGTVMAVMRDGALYVWHHKPLRLAVEIAFLGAVCGQAMQYMAPAVSERMFRHPSTDNAGLLVALGAGALCSWGFYVWSSERVRRSSRVGCTLGIYTTSILVIGSSGHYAVGLLGYFLNGIAHLQLAMSLSTLIQGSVPDHVRGRTTSFYMLGLLAGIPTGAFVIGRLADALGMQQALLLDAAVLGTFAVGLAISGRLRLLDVTIIDEAEEDDIIAVPGLAT
jgi:MFS family permease